MISPEHLQLARASREFFESAFKQFLELNGVWNNDETGCPLCTKSRKVLALSGTKDYYQITTLRAISATGNAIPPMHFQPS